MCQANLNKQLYTLHWFKKVATIPTGGSFGERALIKNEDRAATVVCSEDCSFATLSRIDYNWIIGAAKRRELKMMVEMLRQFRIFESLRNSSLEKIQYLLKKITYRRGHMLYQQDVSVVDGIYLVVSVEFEI